MISFFAIIAFLAAAQAQCPNNGVLHAGTCWYITSFNTATADCVSQCTSVGGVADLPALLAVGSDATSSLPCQGVVDAFGFISTVNNNQPCTQGLGCFYQIGSTHYCTTPTTTAEAEDTFLGGRFCACDIAASSGFTDPHFSGFNGESLDIKHDNEASNNYFNIFCKKNVGVNALFSPNTHELLYMTEFFAKFGDFEMVYNLKGFTPAGQFTTSETSDSTKYHFEGGYASVASSDVLVKFEGFSYHFKVDNMGSDRYLDMYVEGPRRNQQANGIVGRSIVRSYSPEEFSQYSHFLRKSPEDYSCEL